MRGILGGHARGAQRRLGLERFLGAAERVNLGSGLAARLLLGFRERALDHRQIGEHQLAADGLQLISWDSVGTEAAEHHGERVDLTKLCQPLRTRYPTRHVHESNLGRDRFGRRLHLGEHLQTRIGYRHDREVGLTSGRTGARHRREQGRFPAERHTDQAHVLHGRRA